MTDNSGASKRLAPVPADDRRRDLALARPDGDGSLPVVGLVGDTYTILPRSCRGARTPPAATAS